MPAARANPVSQGRYVAARSIPVRPALTRRFCNAQTVSTRPATPSRTHAVPPATRHSSRCARATPRPAYAPDCPAMFRRRHRVLLRASLAPPPWAGPQPIGCRRRRRRPHTCRPHRRRPTHPGGGSTEPRLRSRRSPLPRAGRRALARSRRCRLKRGTGSSQSRLRRPPRCQRLLRPPAAPSARAPRARAPKTLSARRRARGGGTSGRRRSTWPPGTANTCSAPICGSNPHHRLSGERPSGDSRVRAPPRRSSEWWAVLMLALLVFVILCAYQCACAWHVPPPPSGYDDEEEERPQPAPRSRRAVVARGRRHGALPVSNTDEEDEEIWL